MKNVDIIGIRYVDLLFLIVWDFVMGIVVIEVN